jgi:putative membrane protein
MVLNSLNGLPAFLLYFVSALVLVAAYVFVYTRVTAHDEVQLIRKNLPAASISFGLSILGFAIPLASAIAHSVSLLDMVIWGIIALVVQIAVYYLARLLLPDVSLRIENDEMAAAIFLGTASLGAGVLNAASMTY